jgi:hypothetical protein
MTDDCSYKIESFAAMRKRLGWRLHAGILVFVAIGASVTLYLCPGYYWPVSAASGAIGLIFLRFWTFSRCGWFWMTMTAMALIQIPFIIVSRDIANDWKWSFGFLFMIVDFVVMDSVVRWVAPSLSGTHRHLKKPTT